jgi:hypothetical protein
MLVEEFDSLGRNQLLQRPTSGEPSTFPKCIAIVPVSTRVDILEISVANLRFRVPIVHGVDSLRELGTAALVDATGVNPDIIQAIIPAMRTSVFNFCCTKHSSPAGSVDIHKRHLLRAPLEGGTVSISYI